MPLTKFLAAALCALAFHAGAADFPAGPVKIVHGLPGGLVDAGSRVLGELLAARWKQPVVVDGRPGAGEMIAADAVAKAPRDGLTLFAGSETALVNNALLYRKPLVDPQKDLAPVAELFEVPFALVVRGDLPATTLAEFVALARREGDRRVYGSSGPGSPLHLAMEGFSRTAGFRMTHVPYKTMGQLTQDLLGGLVDAVFISVPFAVPFTANGRMRILAVTGPVRSALAPATPTFAEAGWPGVDYRSTIGLMAPAGTPPQTLRRITADVREALQSPEFAARFLQPQGLKAGTADGAGLATLLAARRATTQKLVRELDVSLD